MSVSDADAKLLWGRAAGRCSNPSCRDDLTVILEAGDGFTIGEMAHVIAKSPKGPRAGGVAGSDAYENLVLLCPTCHRKVDKAPAGVYPESTLREWKRAHEQEIRSFGSSETFETTSALKRAIARLLRENRAVWKQLGPNSLPARNDPGSNLYRVWNMRKLDTIVPNNRRIINMVEGNIALLSEDDHEEFLEFKIHAQAFEQHQYNRIDDYPRFPSRFEERFVSE